MASLTEFLKFIIILKEIQKPSGKILRVWAKNKLRFEIFEKVLKFIYTNLNGKLIFYPFSLPSSRTFVILCTSATFQNLGGWGGMGFGMGTFDFGGCTTPWVLHMSTFKSEANDNLVGNNFINFLLVLIFLLIFHQLFVLKTSSPSKMKPTIFHVRLIQQVQFLLSERKSAFNLTMIPLYSKLLRLASLLNRV